MWLASEWDIYPDQWAPWQVTDALAGIVPEWNSDETPRRPDGTKPRPAVANRRARAGA